MANCSTSVFWGEAAAEEPPQVGSGREAGPLSLAEGSLGGCFSLCFTCSLPGEGGEEEEEGLSFPDRLTQGSGEDEGDLKRYLKSSSCVGK